MATENKAPYTMVVGLEVHVQLLTESKMFSWTGTEFGLPPNTLCDPVNLGMPGTLPVMNGKAFNMALKTALACGCAFFIVAAVFVASLPGLPGLPGSGS